MSGVAGIRALVPVKAFSQAKSRLADVLDSDERARLSFWMLERVYGVLGAVPAIREVTIIAGDDATGKDLAGLGADVLIQKGDAGLNGALESAMAHMPPSDCAFVMVVAADLALLGRDDVDELVSQAAAGRVLIAQDRQGRGTNALLFSASEPMRFGFGMNSFAVHRENALALGLEPVAVQSAGFGFDIDTPQDLAQLRSVSYAGQCGGGDLPRFLTKERAAHA